MQPADTLTSCPSCESGIPLGRRDFIRVLGTAAAAAAVGLTPLQKARAARAEKQAAAEALVFELFQTMTAEQKKKLLRPWDHKPTAKDKVPTRFATGNAAVEKLYIGTEYKKTQVELLDKIFRALGNGEEGYRELSRGGRFDASGDFESISALIYGEPVEGKKFSLVFTGHHLTVRCDGNSEEATAFGGPLYYGHTPNGYATTNVFYKQTRAATELYSALDADAKKVAVKSGTWHDEHGGVKVPKKGAKVPGLCYKDMTKDQKEQTEKLMKQLVSPYRKEDGDEVMELIKATGGMEKLSMAFYEEDKTSEKEPWSFWRLEGPGFVWSFRALPHIHTFVHVKGELV
ncbi:DUF3500 domain-containing protein [Frigoriglobus tundricola]|uniref:DUF3500 domain-containing protein n=1 Tax=Frigoriglobus tundricola TaxID=2774151 RepID=A0A6M5Z202_9BACT|nr:DUF3500 domain-containing protein [Frigoriglobus tundricola]QJW99543.1 hypothetical protein FTUN_7155 [Frigoriglobus tundricola]